MGRYPRGCIFACDTGIVCVVCVGKSDRPDMGCFMRFRGVAFLVARGTETACEVVSRARDGESCST